MTKQQLIDAFSRGELDRRGFIGKLSVLGISAGAAAAYASAFAPGVLASTSRNDGGFLVSAFGAQDEEYGTACVYASDDEALAALSNSSADARSVFAALADYSEDDFEAGVYAMLTAIADQLDEQADAVASLSGGTPDEVVAETFDSADDFLSAAADSLSALASAYAGVAPAVTDGEARQTISNIAVVVGGQAAIANLAAGNDPLSESFILPSCPV